MDFKNFDIEKEYDKVTEELRQYVYERDGGLCQVFGGAGTECHHIIYLSAGGKNKANNLILLSNTGHNIVHEEGGYEHSLLLRVKKNEERFRQRII